MADPRTLPVRRIMNVTQYSHHHGNLTIEAPNQTFKQGNLLKTDAATGFAIPAGTSAQTAASQCFLAVRDSENVATPISKLGRVNPTRTMVFEVTANGAAATAALLLAGKEYGTKVDSDTGFQVLDLTDTTNKVWRLTYHTGTVLAPDGGAIGDFNVRVYALLLAQ